MINLDDVLELVRVDSVSGNEAMLAARVYDELVANQALDVQRIGDNVVARTTGPHPKRLMVAGHLDTVPGDVRNSRIEGDVLRGLGACDMKASVAGMLELARDATPRPVEVTWVFYAREEIARSESGLREIAELRPELLVADAAVLAEPTGGRVEAGCQGSLHVRVVLRGSRAHTSRPFTGSNALHRLGDLLTRVARYAPRTVEIDGVSFTEQLQAVRVEGGVANNVVPDAAICVLNHRVAPDRTHDEAVEWLRHYLHECVSEGDEVEILEWAPSARPSLDNAELHRLVELSGATPRAKVGWTDVATFHELAVPATNFGAGDPLLAHRSDESVTLSEVKHFVRVIGDWLGGTSPRERDD